jgi:hypothetical protein
MAPRDRGGCVASRDGDVAQANNLPSLEGGRKIKNRHRLCTLVATDALLSPALR